MLEKAIASMEGYECVQEIQFCGNFIEEKPKKQPKRVLSTQHLVKPKNPGFYSSGSVNSLKQST